MIDPTVLAELQSHLATTLKGHLEENLLPDSLWSPRLHGHTLDELMTAWVGERPEQVVGLAKGLELFGWILLEAHPAMQRQGLPDDDVALYRQHVLGTLLMACRVVLTVPPERLLEA